ncbi:alpha/beta hydrolase family protein [Telmatobacter bradus]|uniref:alpha/beta hydrolase family protein n=1 Tax=Telmatobacter bradus TaxID=474953 RepID=UPI003B4397FD
MKTLTMEKAWKTDGRTMNMLLALFLLPGISLTAWSQQPAPHPSSGEVASDSAKTTPASVPSQTVEHWDVLPLAGNSLHALPAMIGEKDTLPTFTRELLSVQWRLNDPIDLYVIRPKDVAKPPVVLFLYGYPTDADKFRNDAWCQNVVRHGFAAVGFVSALTGQRYHDRPMKEWFISELQESLATSVHDTQMVLNYLATRGDLDMNRVGIFGQGSGGTIALLAATIDPRIQSVDVMDPWGDWPDWLLKSPQIPEKERSNYLKPEFLAKVAPFDPVRLIPQLKGRQLRLQENLFNLAIPDAVRKQIEDASSGIAQIVEYHDSKEYSEKVSTNGKMLEWMQSQLLEGTQTITPNELLEKSIASEYQDRKKQ